MESGSAVNTRSAKHRKAKKGGGLGPVRWVLFAICICVFCFSGYKLYDKYKMYKENKEAYAEINEVVIQPASYNIPNIEQEGESTGPLPQRLANPIPEIDFAVLADMDKNAFGWLYIPDTVMNYPVVRGKDNDYYLNHALGGKWNNGGCPFVDYRNKDGFEDYNTVIYGHHLRNGMMFACLDDYAKQEFYDAHPVVYFTTESGKYILRIFAAYTTHSTSDAYNRSFKNEEAFMNWVDKALEQSKIKTDVEITAQDKVLTLSTCAYNFSGARFVVHCRLDKCPQDNWYEDDWNLI